LQKIYLDTAGYVGVVFKSAAPHCKICEGAWPIYFYLNLSNTLTAFPRSMAFNSSALNTPDSSIPAAILALPPNGKSVPKMI